MDKNAQWNWWRFVKEWSVLRLAKYDGKKVWRGKKTYWNRRSFFFYQFVNGTSNGIMWRYSNDFFPQLMGISLSADETFHLHFKWREQNFAPFFTIALSLKIDFWWMMSYVIESNVFGGLSKVANWDAINNVNDVRSNVLHETVTSNETTFFGELQFIANWPHEVIPSPEGFVWWSKHVEKRILWSIPFLLSAALSVVAFQKNYEIFIRTILVDCAFSYPGYYGQGINCCSRTYSHDKRFRYLFSLWGSRGFFVPSHDSI